MGAERPAGTRKRGDADMRKLESIIPCLLKAAALAGIGEGKELKVWHNVENFYGVEVGGRRYTFDFATKRLAARKCGGNENDNKDVK